MTYAELVRLAPEWCLTDREYGAALYLLGGLLPDHHVGAAITFTPAAGKDRAAALTIDWQMLLDNRVFSTGERILVACAYSLFTNAGHADASLGPILTALDEHCIDRVLEAMKIARGLVPLLAPV